MIESKTYTIQINDDNIKDVLILSKLHKSDLRKISAKIVSDIFNPINETKSFSEYTWSIASLFDYVQMRTMDCAEKIRNMHFDSFDIKTIYVSMERKEILTISSVVNDDVLEEYYNKTYDECSSICPECVFMIAEEKDIDFSIMPKFDRIIEV